MTRPAEMTARGPRSAVTASTEVARPLGTFRTPVRGHAVAGVPEAAGTVEPGQAASLVREPGNPADPLAVAVWVDAADGRPWRIGYLDRLVAGRLAPRLDAGTSIQAEIDGWVPEPDGRWRRPLLRVIPAPTPDRASPDDADVPLRGRPPGVRRRRVCA